MQQETPSRPFFQVGLAFDEDLEEAVLLAAASEPGPANPPEIDGRLLGPQVFRCPQEVSNFFYLWVPWAGRFGLGWGGVGWLSLSW